ncbi:hypothetical protein M5K25_026091 [Dendrobium thyrsiflorum]|uniref:Uncharacterized protein n=1 Tax=Dendrobium thyrsiflorum TaxID=117978 RepID=A0ABD0TWF9_DENTH
MPKLSEHRNRVYFLCTNLIRMVGEWMMDPIKIPWFRHPGSSWSLVYLVRGGSRPNLTEGSLSAAMGCFVQGYLVELGWIGPRVITVYPAVPFGGKTAGQRTRTTSLLARDCLRMDPSDSFMLLITIVTFGRPIACRSPVVQNLFKSLSVSDKISVASRRLPRLGENYEKLGLPPR